MFDEVVLGRGSNPMNETDTLFVLDLVCVEAGLT